MIWTIEFSETAQKQLLKIDKPIQKQILSFIKTKLINASNPRELGKALKGDLGTFWRYRVGDYRLLCQIIDQKIVIQIAYIGHRKNIYK